LEFFTPSLTRCCISVPSRYRKSVRSLISKLSVFELVQCWVSLQQLENTHLGMGGIITLGVPFAAASSGRIVSMVFF
jgi:hypothetical protein